MGEQTASPNSIIMAALSTLTASQLSSFSLALSSTFHRHHLRLASLLSSPTLFTHTLNNLYSLSLPQKSLLIARHLLSFLHLLTPFLSPFTSPSFPSYSNKMRLCDLDSVLMLLFFCEVRQHHPKALETCPSLWHLILKTYCSDTMLNLSAITVSGYEVLGAFVDIVVKCRRFVSAKACSSNIQKEMATSIAAVVALPSVEVRRDGACMECVICREEMREGRDVCELPCQHLFHWMCVLPWLRKRNTCPCCRFRLPTDDVYGEIERHWDVMVDVCREISYAAVD